MCIRDRSRAELKDLGIAEDVVYYPVLEKILEENENIDDLKDALKKNSHELVPKHITKEDIIASINYNIHLELSLIHIFKTRCGQGLHIEYSYRI